MAIHQVREWLRIRRLKRRVRNSPHGWYREGGRVYFRRPTPTEDRRPAPDSPDRNEGVGDGS